MIYSNDIDRLQEIHSEMVELLEDFRRIINRSDDQLIQRRFKSYPYGNIVMQLDNDHEMLGRSPFTLQDIIDQLKSKVPIEGDETEDEEDEKIAAT